MVCCGYRSSIHNFTSVINVSQLMDGIGMVPIGDVFVETASSQTTSVDEIHDEYGSADYV